MTKITYKELRNFLKNSSKYTNCKKIQRCPLIHPGFPGTFNLSFTEYDTLNEFENYENISHDFIFSTIQSCIRPDDIFEKISKEKYLWKYLGVFEMSDIAGQIILKGKKGIEEIHSFQLKKLIEILTKLGLKKENLFPSYHAGGSISKITKGKYTFDFIVPKDSFTKEEFIKCGIPKENLIPDSTRDTFLSLHLHMPTPWGYRNEINYNIGTKENPVLLDIATLEYFLWMPKYSSNEKISKNIIGLKPINNTISVGGIGVERLFMALNEIKQVQEVDYLKKFYDKFKKEFPNLNIEQILKSGEIIRTLHRIFSDIETNKIEKIGKNRKEKIRKMLKILSLNLEKLDEIKIRKLLELHSEVQPWHKNLYKGINPTMERIEAYYYSKQ